MGSSGKRQGQATTTQTTNPSIQTVQTQTQTQTSVPVSGQILQQVQQPQNQQNQQVANQTPNANNTPVISNVVGQLTQLTDQQLADLYKASQKAVLPNQLNDAADQTQKFVFQAGMNEQPTVLSSAEFSNYLSTNKNLTMLERGASNVSYTDQMGTTQRLTGEQVHDMLRYSRFNYIGGKASRGGQALGAGAYFQAGGSGYGGATMRAVLSPNARVITSYDLAQKAQAFAQSHPLFAKACPYTTGMNRAGGNSMSIYAAAMGYNVITDSISRNGQPSGRTVIIDRSALVCEDPKKK